MKSSQKMLVFFICLYLATGCASQDKKNTIKKKADLHYSHGTNALMNKEYTKALQHLGKALELRNNDSKIHNNIGMTYYFKKKFTLAAKHLKKARGGFPNYTWKVADISQGRMVFWSHLSLIIKTLTENMWVWMHQCRH